MPWYRCEVIDHGLPPWGETAQTEMRDVENREPSGMSGSWQVGVGVENEECGFAC